MDSAITRRFVKASNYPSPASNFQHKELNGLSIVVCDVAQILDLPSDILEKLFKKML